MLYGVACTPSLDRDPPPQSSGNISSRLSWLRPHSAVVGPCHKKGAFCLGLGSRRLPLPRFLLSEFAQDAVLHELEHVWRRTVEGWELGKHLHLGESGLVKASVEAGIGTSPPSDTAERSRRADLRLQFSLEPKIDQE